MNVTVVDLIVLLSRYPANAEVRLSALTTDAKVDFHALWVGEEIVLWGPPVTIASRPEGA